MTALDVPEGVVIDGVINPGFEKVLTKEAVAFVADLQRRFNPRRVREESDKVKAEMGEAAYADGRYEDAARLMLDLV